MAYPSSGSPPSFAIEYETASATWVDVASHTLRFNCEQEIFDPLHPVRGLEALVELDNHDGTYNPSNLAVLNIGRLMRIRITDTGSHLFYGRIKYVSIDPQPMRRSTVLNLESLLSFYNRTTVTTSMQADSNPASLFAHILSRINSTTGLFSAEAISSNDNISFAWYRDREVTGALQQLVEYGFYPLREHGDGILQLYNRSTGLVGGGAAVDTVTECFGMGAVWDSAMIINKAKVSGTPRKIDTNPATVAWLEQTISVTASSAVGFWMTYVDPVEITVPTPAVSLTTPVSSSDWVLNTQSDNGGSYLMATASLAVTFFGETAVCSLYNGSGSDGYLTKFQVRGLPVRVQPYVSAEDEDSSSQINYGMHQLAVSNDFIDKRQFASWYSTHLVRERGQPVPRLNLALKNDWPLIDKIVPGRNIAVINSNAGVNSFWVVRRVVHDVSMLGGIEHVQQVEGDFLVDRPWFILDDATRGTLDDGNQLAW